VPTYEYACDSCSNRYEKREGFDAPARQKCPRCGKPANRVLFAPPVVFKGSGFYKTDSRSTSSATADSGPAPSVPAVDGNGHDHGAGGHTHGSTDTTTEPAATT
jgi:putative FmdB family regulatory protein